MTRNADNRAVLTGRKIPPNPPLIKWGTRCAMPEEHSSLWQREARRDLKMLTVNILCNLTPPSRKAGQASC